MSLLIVPLIPEIINSTLNQKPRIPENNAILCDKASAMSLTTQSLGYICGPIVGGALQDQFGFRGTTDFLLCMILLYSVVFYWLNVHTVIKNKESPRKQIEIKDDEDN